MFEKLLKDFPLNSWIDAADTCEFCGRKYAIKITETDKSGKFGNVTWRIYHTLDCPERFNEEEEIIFSPGEYEEGEDFAGWDFRKNTITILGMTFKPLKSRANIGPCLICEKLVVRVPLILFIGQGKLGELDFCFTCAKEKGILDHLVPPKGTIELESKVKVKK